MFGIRCVDVSQAEALEQVGSKRSFWFDDHRFLFKPEERGSGEDWAEVISAQLCQMLGMPHVGYELAVLCNGERELKPGVICANIAAPPRELFLGNVLLAKEQPYPQQQQR
ncbi:MAG TPA: hypothetical protein VL992_03190, partial [Tepidisphaeraceae bacterium]|nr:hypothetical protein [Tepidisphaeraceae bacterium]